MSHHLDSPLARRDPRLNITDQYVFDDNSNIVFVMDVRTSLAGDQSPDPFHAEARYELKIHLDGNDREDVTYRFAFDHARGGTQTYTLERLTGLRAGDDSADGDVVASATTGQVAATTEGGRVWAGEAVEPFYIDLSQLDAVDRTVLHGENLDLTRWVPGVAVDTFAGSTVQSIVLSLPVGTGELRAGRKISTWCTSKLATDAGGWRQVGRTALPMIWPIFRDNDGDEASHANETHPADDVENYGATIAGLIASVVERRGTSDRPGTYAANVVERIVPDLLGYEIGSPALFGFAKFNGRRLADNAPEVMFSIATNSALSSGVKAHDLKRSQSTFPFVVPVAR